jgi:WhiB family transcriptional regulator, redox-sensing transcriptional regulator
VGWGLEAACRQLPTELFFPIGHGSRAQAQTTVAKSICSSCPVRSECLEYALRANLQYGVFGGLAEEERRQVQGPVRSGFQLSRRLGEPA